MHPSGRSPVHHCSLVSLQLAGKKYPETRRTKEKIAIWMLVFAYISLSAYASIHAYQYTYTYGCGSKIGTQNGILVPSAPRSGLRACLQSRGPRGIPQGCNLSRVVNPFLLLQPVMSCKVAVVGDLLIRFYYFWMKAPLHKKHLFVCECLISSKSDITRDGGLKQEAAPSIRMNCSHPMDNFNVAWRFFLPAIVNL